tara:strand:+ start:72 stop:236 length:165 start_codon:yes stop_codon:yes gene_type:complete
MNYYLITYSEGEDATEVRTIERELYIENYDGDPYGDTVPICVGSNQSIIEVEDF